MDDIPYGYCGCGCGKRTTIAGSTRKQLGHVRGRPTPYLLGHFPGHPGPLYAIEDRGYLTPCWIWHAKPENTGYCRVKVKGERMGAHVLAFIQRFGEIREGYHIHHRCHVRSCVNPDHLEAMSPTEHARVERAKLTPDAVRVIRGGTMRTGDLASKYGVSGSTIDDVKFHRTWKDIV